MESRKWEIIQWDFESKGFTKIVAKGLDFNKDGLATLL